jgi:hypothetical protein
MHKTGTTVLQTYLAVNRVALALGGVHYPRAGRHQLPDGHVTPGHHQIAFDFMREEGSAAFAQAIDEMRTVQASTVILSSEEFHRLLERRGALETIAAHARELGYGTVALVVLRAQPEYLESLYAEIAKTELPPPFEDVIAAALDEGAFTLRDGRRFTLAYPEIVAGLEAVLGAGNVVARAYHHDRGPAFILRDFLEVIAALRGRLELTGSANPLPRANERFTLAGFLAAVIRAGRTPVELDELLRAAVPQLEPADLDAPVVLATNADRARLLARFAAGNAALNARFAIDIPFVEAGDAIRDAAGDARAQRHRRALAAVLDAVT